MKKTPKDTKSEAPTEESSPEVGGESEGQSTDTKAPISQRPSFKETLDKQKRRQSAAHAGLESYAEPIVEAPAALTASTPTEDAPTEEVTNPPSEDAPETDEAEENEPREVKGLKKMGSAERNKRQAAERELAEARALNLQLQQRAQQQEQELLQLRQDPYQTQAQDLPLEDSDPRVQEKLFQMSAYVARQQHEDFDEKMAVYEEEARNNPQLRAEVMNHPVPAEAAYIVGKTVQFRKEMGTTPDEITANMKKKLAKEIRAEVTKEFEQKFQGQFRARQNTPTNLLAQRAATGTPEPEYRMRSFKEVLARTKGR